jgi:hypothetical protein
VRLLAIDPGTEESGYVVLDDDLSIDGHGIIPNQRMLQVVTAWPHRSAIEWVVSYGKPIGKDTIETIYWIGRFLQASRDPNTALRIPRKVVTKHICNDGGAKDPQVRQALIDLYPRAGGGAIPQIGTRGTPGPLYGIRKHEWAALAVAHTARHHWEVESIAGIL